MAGVLSSTKQGFSNLPNNDTFLSHPATLNKENYTTQLFCGENQCVFKKLKLQCHKQSTSTKDEIQQCKTLPTMLTISSKAQLTEELRCLVHKEKEFAMKLSKERSAKNINSKEIDAAKQTVRKELIQSVLNLPFPEPDVSDERLFATNNCSQFMVNVGLEEVVNMRELMQTNEEVTFSPVSYPHLCNFCKTDFSPEWKKICNSDKICCLKCRNFARKKQIRQERAVLFNTLVLDAMKKARKTEEKIINQQLSKEIAYHERSRDVAVAKVLKEFEKQDKFAELKRLSYEKAKPARKLNKQEFATKKTSCYSLDRFAKTDIRSYFKKKN